MGREGAAALSRALLVLIEGSGADHLTVADRNVPLTTVYRTLDRHKRERVGIGSVLRKIHERQGLEDQYDD
jgi:hypothetical protein